jgi:hypothetical protein
LILRTKSLPLSLVEKPEPPTLSLTLHRQKGLVRQNGTTLSGTGRSNPVVMMTAWVYTATWTGLDDVEMKVVFHPHQALQFYKMQTFYPRTFIIQSLMELSPALIKDYYYDKNISLCLSANIKTSSLWITGVLLAIQ